MAFFPVKGFLSTGATFEADLNLLVQVVMGFKDWKRWMGAELTLWSIVVLTRCWDVLRFVYGSVPVVTELTLNPPTFLSLRNISQKEEF